MSDQLYSTKAYLLATAYWLASQIGFLALFRNHVTLSSGFNPASLQEANYSGYARIPIGGAFAAAVLDLDGRAVCEAPLQIFRKSGMVTNPTIYGMYYLDFTGTIVQMAQTFIGGPYPMVADTDIIPIRPLIQASNPIFP